MGKYIEYERFYRNGFEWRDSYGIYSGTAKSLEEQGWNCPVDLYTNEYEAVFSRVRYKYDDNGFSIEDGVLEKYIDSDRNEFYSSQKHSKKVVIPNGVKKIGKQAFVNCVDLQEILIPKSVNFIEDDAFAHCENLNTITLPDRIEHIGAWAFYNTKYYNDESNWIDGVLYIGNYLLHAKTNISGHYSIKEGTVSVAKQAFWECENLTSVNIPNSVTSIAPITFEKCKNLECVTIGNTILSIGDFAFWGCEKLTKVIIPDSVTSIGVRAFCRCSSLNEVIIGKGVQQIDEEAFWGCEKLTKVIIPDSVTSIGVRAFCRCSSLNEVIIGKGLQEINEEAFACCDNLTTIEINCYVTESVGDDSFRDCYKLTIYGHAGDLVEVYAIENNIPFVSMQDFWIENGVLKLYAGKDTKVIVPEGVTEIGPKSFTLHRGDIESVELPLGLIKIGEMAFRDCYYLETIKIPDTVTSIGTSAFMGCESLSEIAIPNSVTSIGRSAFYGCNGIRIMASSNSYAAEYAKKEKIQYIDIDSIVERKAENIPQISHDDFLIEDGVLIKYKGREKRVVLPNNIVEIGSNALRWCSTLECVTILDGVKCIGKGAFESCDNLMEIILPDSITDIGKEAFMGCQELECITLPVGLKYIKDHTFDGCKSLVNLAIPDGVEEIGDNAFKNCQRLKSIIIPNSVTEIGEGAFEDCEKLEEIILSQEIGEIKDHTFDGCKSLVNLTIPDGVEEIGFMAFNGCKKLQNIIIPDSVTDIGYMAFYNCKQMSIHGSKSSFAREYAQKENIPFVSTDISNVEDCSEIQEKEENASSSENLLNGTVDLYIGLAMSDYKAEECSMGLMAMLLGGAGRLGSNTEHYAYMLRGLYRYYNYKGDVGLIACYKQTLQAMASWLSSSTTINQLKTSMNNLTPIVAVDTFLGVLLTELDYEKKEVSPFKISEAVDYLALFIKGIKEDSELLLDDEVLRMVKQYMVTFNQEYNIGNDIKV